MNKKTMVSITEANQNFSKVARLVDEKGSAVILKNNAPKYIMVPYEEVEEEYISEDELKKISDKFLEKNKKAYKKLAE
ncbi:type II toxin-antitoxin system Phd/YefM family antitoxin [Anaerococcus provencensis]|uniref:type II toxin-antitoxin system Phd/YefM family antitoxin n=1 Tax=Anaerococcus provencensis TaxID=938293 RepID=UPI0002F17427|nr:type II toxin-antitoxin system Phd/YefM family antitoxin [Anaerococcus provencensis]